MSSIADDGRWCCAGYGSTMLLAVLASGAFWMIGHLAGCGMESAACFCLGEDPSSQEKLNLFEADVSKSVVPPKEFLFSFGEVVIGVVNLRYRGDEGVGGLEWVVCTVCLRCWEVVLWVDQRDHWTS